MIGRTAGRGATSWVGMTNDELAVLLRKTILSVLLEEVVGWESRPVLEQLRLVLECADLAARCVTRLGL